MSYPLGVVTRTITVGDSLAVESGTDLTVRATLRSSRGLVWIATGERAVSAPEVRESAAAGEAVAFTPPVTDQAGWRDLATGALIDVSAPNAHTHTYTIELVTLRGERPVDRRIIGPFPLPTGDGTPVDADLLISADTVPGLLVSVPDAWGGMVAAAEAAAVAASAAASSAGDASASSAADAADSAIAAGLARDGAVTAQGRAETAQGLAEDAHGAAATSAGQASTSAGLAAGSASSAATSAGLAAGSASSADTSAGSASTAASNASTAAGVASSAASDAAQSATTASQQAALATTARQGAEAARDATVALRNEASALLVESSSITFTATSESVTAGTPVAVNITGGAPDFNIDFDIPSGRDAYIESATPPTDTSMLWLDTTVPSLPETGSPFELRGYGMPNGVVSAPTGTYYTDVVGTNGAWRWLKTSGSGNTGWVVTVGDTGPINTAPITIGGRTPFTSRIGRRGDMVYWYIYYNANNNTPATETFTGWLPEGFRPPANVVATLHGLSPVSIAVASKFQITSSGTVTTAATYGGGSLCEGEMRWFTSNPWPTTLVL